MIECRVDHLPLEFCQRTSHAELDAVPHGLGTGQSREVQLDHIVGEDVRIRGWVQYEREQA